MYDEDKCMNNSYLLVTGKKNLEEFFKNQEDVFFMHNPDEPILDGNYAVYDVLIDHFIYTEEYEKCQELKNLKELG
jgi:hypothetical protein|tara:strand:+ start:677 stop:904 length:228 start_codon:yes stop_codon:yes gene_type:complete